MPEEENEAGTEESSEGGKSKLLMIIILILVVVIAVVVGAMFFMGGNDTEIEKVNPVAEFVVKEKMYQLKDGAYLRLSFSIVVDADKVSQVQEIIETSSPGRLPDTIHMLLGNKTREDLIAGSHSRQAFARELKKSIDEQVFSNYNKDKPPKEQIKVYDVLISDYVTQSG